MASICILKSGTLGYGKGGALHYKFFSGGNDNFIVRAIAAEKSQKTEKPHSF